MADGCSTSAAAEYRHCRPDAREGSVIAARSEPRRLIRLFRGLRAPNEGDDIGVKLAVGSPSTLSPAHSGSLGCAAAGGAAWSLHTPHSRALAGIRLGASSARGWNRGTGHRRPQTARRPWLRRTTRRPTSSSSSRHCLGPTAAAGVERHRCNPSASLVPMSDGAARGRRGGRAQHEEEGEGLGPDLGLGLDFG